LPAVLAHVLPFFLIVALGWAARRLSALSEAAAEGLIAYVFWIGFPALLIDALARSPAPSAAFARGLIAYGLAMGATLGLALAAGALGRWEERTRAGAAMAAGVGNTAFLGLPLAVAVFGEAARPAAAGMVAIDFVLILGLGVALAARAEGRSLGKAALGALVNPVVIGACVGVALAAFRISLPPLIATPLSALAATGSPVALVALGAVLAQPAPEPASRLEAPVLIAGALKLLVAPALAFAVMTLMGAPADVRRIGVLLAACPTAVNVFIQTRAYVAWPAGVARIVAATTAISVLTLTVLAMWLA
jgi:malonate transporter